MGTIINETTNVDKAFYWVLGLIMVAFLISVPFMVRNDNRLKVQAWQEQGCEMYDNEKPADIPAKCSQYFVDHYKPQPARTQPPQEPISTTEHGKRGE